MAKLFSSELHRNENASIEFNAAIGRIIWSVREHIAILAKSRKADEYAPGAIHALRKLCDGEQKCMSIYELEVGEWEQCFFAWLERVKRSIAPDIYTQLRAHAEADFRAIRAAAGGVSVLFSRADVEQRRIVVTVPSEETLEKARKAADLKHPVRLGSALHIYLKKCVTNLIGETVAAENIVADKPAVAVPDPTLRFTFQLSDDGMMSLTFSDFRRFDTEEDVAQDILVTGYDVEHAVKDYVAKHHPKRMRELNFDSESSMFCVRSVGLSALTLIAEILVRFATDRAAYAQYAAKG